MYALLSEWWSLLAFAACLLLINVLRKQPDSLPAHLKKTLLYYLITYVPPARAFYRRQEDKIREAMKLKLSQRVMETLPEHPIDPLTRLRHVDEEDDFSVTGVISGCRYTLTREDSIKAFAQHFMTWEDDPLKQSRLRSMAQEVLGKVVWLLDYKGAAGLFTSGGTQSIYQAILAARNNKPGLAAPNIVFAKTAHVAMNKAAAYYGLELKEVPYDQDYRLPVESLQAAIDQNTVLVYSSYPNYPYGSCQDVRALAQFCSARKVELHLDLCLGGFVVPFLKDSAGKPLLTPIPKGVSSISIDPHKYGLSGKGASILLFKDAEYASKAVYTHQRFGYKDGTFLGKSIPYGVATSWAALRQSGLKTYRANAELITTTIKRMRTEVQKMGLQILGKDEVCVLAFHAKTPEVDCGIRKIMKEKHWHVSFLVNPMCLHISMTVPFCKRADDFLRDLRTAIEEVNRDPTRFSKLTDEAELYGATEAIPKQEADSLLYLVLQSIYDP